MKWKLLIALFLPVPIFAQVQRVISNDYLSLIRNDTDSLQRTKKDTTNSMLRANMVFRLGTYYPGSKLKKTNSTTNPVIFLKGPVSKVIGFTGSYSLIFERQYMNRLPQLQKEYAQGQSVNGSLQWRGPETGEVFSYGPSIQTLEFDGGAYAYDINGHLVTKGTGNGVAAKSYNNSIFRPANLITHSLMLNAKYRRNEIPIAGLSINAGQSYEQTFIRHNNNENANFGINTDATIGKVQLSGSITSSTRKFNHSNRAGFLNQAYQSSLLSPITFDSRQGTMTGNEQRSHSPFADNAFFLLEDQSHFFRQIQTISSLSAERKYSRGIIRISQSLEKKEQSSNEGFQKSSSYFPNGITANRHANDRSYSLTANGRYKTDEIFPYVKAEAVINYIYSNNKSSIEYDKNNQWSYQRTIHDLALSFNPEWNYSAWTAGTLLANKSYFSNTSKEKKLFLPGIAAYISRNNVLWDKTFFTKLFGNANRFVSETSIGRSLAGTLLLNKSIAEAGSYFPLSEVKTYRGVSPVEHRETSIGFESWYKNSYGITFTWFNRKTFNEIFPVANGNEILLKNLADYRNRGFELQLTSYSRFGQQGKISLTNNLSYNTYKNKVTGTRNNNDYIPITGFRDVYKAIVKGQPLGVIVGNTWKRDVAGRMIIGADGFPLQNSTASVIGNPFPDFTMKWSSILYLKEAFSFNIDLEWRKGGDCWNGTHALLDYYGRSTVSAQQRSIKNFIFPGVNENGIINNVPVEFYNPSQPVEQNRWVRYGAAGVAEDYIEDGSTLRINNLSVTWKKTGKPFNPKISVTLYASNIILWSAYQGTDPSQLLYDQAGTAGLDFFNLPSARSFGLSTKIQF